MCSASTFVGFVVVFCAPSAVVGDLPVHCTQPQALGIWRFHVGSYGGDAQCGFRSPDDPDGHHDLTPPIRDAAKKERGNYWLSEKFQKSFSLDVVFRDWSTEVLSVSDEGKQAAHKDFQSALPGGQWTLVYDEGFHNAMKGASGLEHSFFAFYKFMLGNDDSSHSTDSFGNAKHSFCDMSLLGWYKQIDPTTGTILKEECFWAEKISTLEKAIAGGQIPPPVALPLPVPIGDSASRALDDSPAPKALPDPGQSGGLPVAGHNQGDSAALRGGETKKVAGIEMSMNSIVRIGLQVALGVSVLVAAAGMWMGRYYKDESERSISSNCWRAAVVASLIAATFIFGFLWTHGLAQSHGNVPTAHMAQRLPPPNKPQSIKEWAVQMHEENQAAKQSGKPVRWTSDPNKLKAWVDERREKFGVQITEDSEVQELLDVVSPPLASGLPGFHSESVIFAQRAAAVAEQTQLADSLGKPVHEMTTDDLHAANWTSQLTNHHQIRTFTMDGQALKVDDWKTLKNFDWRKVSLDMGNGEVLTDFVNDVPDQGGCGSCYAVAATSMITSRLMLKYPELHSRFASKKGADRLSVEQQMQCNPYNQGCAGGYPYLVAKWSFENEMKTHSCVSEAMKALPGSCPSTWDSPGCADSFRVYTWRYVGGALGRCGLHHLCEAAIREELYKGGPMAVSIEPSGFGYSGGVLHATPGLEDKSLSYEAHTSKDLADCKDAECYIWRKVDHSVLLVGWGEDNSKGLSCQARFPKISESDLAKNPVKTCEKIQNADDCGQNSACVWQGFPFWTVQNSYGKGFGENGYLSFGPRGQDVMRVESMVLSADVEWIGRASGKAQESRQVPEHQNQKHSASGHRHAEIKRHT